VNAKAASPQPCIYVIAGPNGGGKSSIVGAMLLQAGGDYFNPDVESKRIRDENPNISESHANSMAWRLGKSILERAIREQKTFAFETTLGGKTIASLLGAAVERGLQLKIWFICLSTPELHIQRVRSRVAKGGHDIPEGKIRERFERGRANLLGLLPKITELRLYDNTFDADPDKGVAPEPLLVLHLREGQIVQMCDAAKIPNWAKPIVELAMRMSPARST
jgi:predicted ABC-type ATPase